MRKSPFQIWPLLIEWWQNPPVSIFVYWNGPRHNPLNLMYLTLLLIIPHRWCNNDFFILLGLPTKNARKQSDYVIEVNNEVNAGHKLINN